MTTRRELPAGGGLNRRQRQATGRVAAGCLFTVKVPATTANLGPGFDSIGLALGFGLTVDVYPGEPWGSGEAGCRGEAGAWRVDLLDPALHGLPRDENNLIVSTALLAAAERGVKLPVCRLEVRSDIPLARGLGSSAAAIVAGVELANELCDLGLSDGERLALATRVEGHPDNVAAALFGGLTVVAGARPDETTFVRASVPPAEVVLCIPDYPVRTQEARAVLPATLPYRDAVQASARSNVLVAALLSGDWGLAGRMMAGDVFHEPYREVLMPDLAGMREAVRRSQAYGSTLSGSGPTLIAFTARGRGPALAGEFRRRFPRFDVRVTEPAQKGAAVVRWSRAPSGHGRGAAAAVEP